MRRVVRAVVAGTLLLLAACTHTSSEGATAGPAATGPAATSSSPGPSAPASSAPGASSTPAPTGSAPTSPPTASQPPTRSTSARLRAFVLAGSRAGAAHYRYSADSTGESLHRNSTAALDFTTPSGNIACELRPSGGGAAGGATCWVLQLAAGPPRPANCHLQWLPGLVGLGGGHVEAGGCVGGVPLPRFSHVLPYGSTLVDAGAGVACRSDAKYLACVALSTGSGFRADRTTITTVPA